MTPVPIARVACGSCHACCKNTLVVILPEDTENLTHYEVEAFSGDLLKLKQKPNGDCIHLGERGCEVYPLHPVMCRVYDCVAQFQKYSRVERRRLVREGQMSAKVFAAARERIGK